MLTLMAINMSQTDNIQTYVNINGYKHESNWQNTQEDISVVLNYSMIFIIKSSNSKLFKHVGGYFYTAWFIIKLSNFELFTLQNVTATMNNFTVHRMCQTDKIHVWGFQHSLTSPIY